MSSRGRFPQKKITRRLGVAGMKKMAGQFATFFMGQNRPWQPRRLFNAAVFTHIVD
ncbi:MAG: hypothetical protein ORN57_01265 [Alphaproteobacteria bacterium]|nr:hypothetical protein [Alphaproteobacteria bacterium]